MSPSCRLTLEHTELVHSEKVVLTLFNRIIKSLSPPRFRILNEHLDAGPKVNCKVSLYETLLTQFL